MSVDRPGNATAGGSAAEADDATDARLNEAGSTAREPVIELEHVSKSFAMNDSLLDRLLGNTTSLAAVSNVSLSVHRGETLGVVGESGSGKSTLANLVTGLYTPTEGVISLDGTPVGGATDRPADLLADVGVVFQNASSSINPRMTVGDAIAEPLITQGWSADDCEERIAELLELVELSEHHLDRYTHELSGGQAQRVSIARAIATEPSVLVLDEPVSALDVSVKGSILNLLMRIQDELDLTYLLISHDLSAVKHVADRIAVMYVGELMEVGPAEELFERPAHPYTEALLAAIPNVDPASTIEDTFVLEGEVPSPVDPPSGCVFHTRCPMAEETCRTTVPDQIEVGDGWSRCHFAESVADDEEVTDAWQ
ncbi:oligopeptide/dipeptide ABC transporter, ATP-binding protein [Halovivax ruber XH-70]|uniref:Oligopeptide/dipeptide ABC transporter, ATP-binding protein n=1 Tax=Halovivax ruber (strain DSM 18193 / JCM 13892 / XH-70) TaxID=797302 RepID=L0IG24_HALRX|nr:ABC transporter ATP-binding protein [Halovivax ruber]AGB16922.1 oligopeptide/dipeptide ABC transporter, ATP-binding protein [Halovivax ruber XH-70]